MFNINEVAINRLKTKYHQTINLEDLSYESLIFDRDEIDDLSSSLPETVLVHVYLLPQQYQLVLVTDVDNEKVLLEKFESCGG